MTSTLDLLQQIANKEYVAATKTFTQLADAKKSEVENREYKSYVTNLFRKEAN